MMICSVSGSINSKMKDRNKRVQNNRMTFFEFSEKKQLFEIQRVSYLMNRTIKKGWKQLDMLKTRTNFEKKNILRGEKSARYDKRILF